MFRRVVFLSFKKKKNKNLIKKNTKKKFVSKPVLETFRVEKQNLFFFFSFEFVILYRIMIKKNLALLFTVTKHLQI